MEYKKLDELLEYIQPTKYIVDSENYDDSFPTPVLTAGKSFILGYTDETNGIYFASKENPIILFDDFTTECKLVDFAFKVKSSACKILKPKKDVNIKYVYYAMKNIDIDTALHKRYWISIYSQQTIPFPIPIIQENIVSEIEVINEAIEYNEHKIKYLEELIKSRFIEMFGDPIQNEKAWNSLILNEVTDVRDGTHDSPKYYDKGYPFVTSKNLIEGKIDFSTCQLISEEDYLHFNVRSRVDDGDILMPMIGTIGGAIIVKKDREFSIKNVALIKFTKDNSKINRTFILYILNSDSMNNYFELTKKGGNQKFIALGVIRNIPIIVPPIELQNEFDEFVKLIDKSKLIVQQEIKLLNELLEVKTNEYFS